MFANIFSRRRAHDQSVYSPKSECTAIINRLDRHLQLTGQYLGAFDETPGYATRVMADGLHLATSTKSPTSIIMAELVSAVSFAGDNATRLATVDVSAFFRQPDGSAPSWAFTDVPQGVKAAASITISSRWDMRITCTDEQVDPGHDGLCVPGATVILQMVHTKTRKLH